ncbi:replication protein P [Parabacteroides goldsteinii]
MLQFRAVLATFPASLANRDQNEVNEIRRQWVLAFRENGITTMEQVNAGMRVARRQNRPFLPSPGQFVAWCREEASVTAGLPNVSELVDMVYEYCRKRGLYPDAESYPWKSNAHYWLVTNLYQNMRANALTDAELRRKAFWLSTAKWLYGISTQKIGLACKDEEGLQRVFNEVITGSHVRDGHRETPKEIMYRGRMSLDGIAKMYSENDYQALYQDMVRAKRFDTGSCSESCEIFGGQLDFDFGREAA